MATFSLDDIRAAAEKQFGSTDIDMGEGKVVRLVNALRLSKDERKALVAIQEKLGEDDAEQEEVLRDALRIAAEDKDLVEELISAIGDDLAVLVELFKKYSGETELGEASASES